MRLTVDDVQEGARKPPPRLRHPIPHPHWRLGERNGRGASDSALCVWAIKTDLTSTQSPMVSGPSPGPAGEGWPKAGVGATFTGVSTDTRT